jgi:hypothetical protein
MDHAKLVILHVAVESNAWGSPTVSPPRIASNTRWSRQHAVARGGLGSRRAQRGDGQQKSTWNREMKAHRGRIEGTQVEGRPNIVRAHAEAILLLRMHACAEPMKHTFCVDHLSPLAAGERRYDIHHQ